MLDSSSKSNMESPLNIQGFGPAPLLVLLIIWKTIYLGRGITRLFQPPSVTPRRCCLSNDFHLFSALVQLIDIDAQSNLCL